MTQTSETNREQREYWTGEGAEYWRQRGDWWNEMFAPFGRTMLDAADLRPGNRVLDVGCGFGATTIEAAERVAPDGAAVGVDISPQLLEVARTRAAGAANIDWLEADAQVHPFEAGSYDVVISRFAAMLFDDPPTAFANLHRALRPGGRLAFVCWQHPMNVEWIAVSIAAAVAIVGQPPDLGDPGAPGPFAFADGDRARELVAAGGFSDVAVEPVTRPTRLGADLAEAADAVLRLQETQEMLEGTPEGTQQKANAALQEAFAPYAGPAGVVLDASAWLVTAHR